MVNLATLEKLLIQGKDTSLLRFGLGKGYLDAGDAAKAVAHLERCVELDADYSSAWKLLGKGRIALDNGDSAQLGLGTRNPSCSKTRGPSIREGNDNLYEATHQT